MIVQPEQSLPKLKCFGLYLWITWLKLVELGVLSVGRKGYICGEKNEFSKIVNDCKKPFALRALPLKREDHQSSRI
jgi:hypothetical protein